MVANALQILDREPIIMTPKQEAIVTAAAELFLERGYGDVSMDAIASKASVSKRTVYSYYQNKETLFGDVMSLRCQQIGGMEECPLTNQELITSLLPPDVLQKTGEHVLRIITSPQVNEMYRVVTAEAVRFPELGKTYFGFGPAWVIEQLRMYMDDQVRLGTLDIPDTQKGACNFLGMVIFPLQMQMMLGLKSEFSEDELSDAAKSAVDTFMRAFAVS